MASPPPGDRPTPRPVNATAPSRVAAMLASLTALLDSVHEARQKHPHLAALEIDLKRHGLVVLHRAPVPALLKASEELAALPMNPDDAPLQELGTILLGEMEARSRRRSGGFMSTFVSESRLVVSEGSHTDFMEAAGLAPPKKPG